MQDIREAETELWRCLAACSDAALVACVHAKARAGVQSFLARLAPLRWPIPPPSKMLPTRPRCEGACILGKLGAVLGTELPGQAVALQRWLREVHIVCGNLL